ncbi:MAG: dihydroneopterin aldolase [Candidatus Eremiobacteraeota bacterium]|nr:dihydroneopterin aldolase [Candidatus Eremiobacteraeota bacterium]
MDTITLRGIRVNARHGAYEGERDREQPFEIELRLEIDLRAAESSDDLGDTIDYNALHKTVVGIVQQTSFALLERLAGEILRAVFRDACISRAEVEIGKPGILDGATAAVTLARENPRYRKAFP